jgi:ribosomal protein S18 acetylase RimI-like enzyme
VQKNNRQVVKLYRKLGFQLREREGGGASLDVIGGRGLLDSETLRRLEKAVAARDAHSHGESV